jgi:hypothetical protein
MTASKSEVKFFSRRLHLACWLIPAILTFLPLSTNTFGNYNDSAGLCFLDKHEGTPAWATSFWMLTSFYLWIFIAMFYYFAVVVFMAIRFKSLYSSSVSSLYSDVVYRAVSKLMWYPFIILLCWFCTVFDGLHNVRFSNKNQGKLHNWRQLFAVLGPSLQGFLTTVVYMIFHREKKASSSFKNNIPDSTRNHIRDVDSSNMMDVPLVDGDDDMS